MTRYAATLFGALVALLVSFGGFTLLVDPYDVVRLASIEGVNARKSRVHEDGFRVRVGHRLLATDSRAIVIGSSRVADGFPPMDDAFEGGVENLGIGGANAFVLGRASVTAARNDAIDCVVIGLDLREFSPIGVQATYWITPLAGGPRLFSYVRMALSPHAFARALQTVVDNITGGEDTAYENAYALDEQRQRFDETPRKRFRAYMHQVYDPGRMKFLFRAIDGLLAEGVQVLVFIHPVHAWYEEAVHRAGAFDLDKQMRRDLAAAVDARGEATADAPCVGGPALQLWDFGGYQTVSTSPPPAEDQTFQDPYYLEPDHYTPRVGSAILARMAGETQEAPFDAASFGVRLTTDNVEDVIADIERRRARWLADDPWGARMTEIFDALVADPPPEEKTPLEYITRDETRRLERDVRALIRDARRGD